MKNIQKILFGGVDSKNTLTLGGQEKIISSLIVSDTDNTNQAILLTHPSGARYFSTGMDLKSALSSLLQGNNIGKRFVSSVIHDIYTPTTLTKPVIGVLDKNAVALGGGIELLLASDYLILSPDAKMGLPEMRFGFMPGAGGIPNGIPMLGRENVEKLLLGEKRMPMVSTQDLNQDLFDKQRVFVTHTGQSVKDIVDILSKTNLCKRNTDQYIYEPIDMSLALSDKCIHTAQKIGLETFLNNIGTHISYTSLRKAEEDLVLDLLCTDMVKNKLKDFSEKTHR